MPLIINQSGDMMLNLAQCHYLYGKSRCGRRPTNGAHGQLPGLRLRLYRAGQGN